MVVGSLLWGEHIHGPHLVYVVEAFLPCFMVGKTLLFIEQDERVTVTLPSLHIDKQVLTDIIGNISLTKSR